MSDELISISYTTIRTVVNKKCKLKYRPYDYRKAIEENKKTSLIKNIQKYCGDPLRISFLTGNYEALATIINREDNDDVDLGYIRNICRGNNRTKKGTIKPNRYYRKRILEVLKEYAARKDVKYSFKTIQALFLSPAIIKARNK